MVNFGEGFSYAEDFGTIKFCGQDWKKLSNSNIHSSAYNFPLYEGFLSCENFGELYIKSDAFAIINSDETL
jgi:hypothetical protein